MVAFFVFVFTFCYLSRFLKTSRHVNRFVLIMVARVLLTYCSLNAEVEGNAAGVSEPDWIGLAKVRFNLPLDGNQCCQA